MRSAKGVSATDEIRLLSTRRDSQGHSLLMIGSGGKALYCRTIDLRENLLSYNLNTYRPSYISRSSMLSFLHSDFIDAFACSTCVWDEIIIWFICLYDFESMREIFQILQYYYISGFYNSNHVTLVFMRFYGGYQRHRRSYFYFYYYYYYMTFKKLMRHIAYIISLAYIWYSNNSNYYVGSRKMRFTSYRRFHSIFSQLSHWLPL